MSTDHRNTVKRTTLIDRTVRSDPLYELPYEGGRTSDVDNNYKDGPSPITVSAITVGNGNYFFNEVRGSGSGAQVTRDLTETVVTEVVVDEEPDLGYVNVSFAGQPDSWGVDFS